LAGPLALFPAGGGYANYPARYIAAIRTGLLNDLRALPRHDLTRGFVLDGPRCVTLEAWLDGAPRPVRRVVSFGAGDCPRA
jgi:hypothetical protein